MIRPRTSGIGVKALAAAVLALTPGGLLAAGESLALPAPFETYGGTAWTVADFDGDGHPDLLTARPEVAGPGFRHRIQIQLSGAGRTVTFAIDGIQPGIQIAARDVNGDHDIDLVFTTAVSHQPVGIWLNNGAGGFARDRNAAYGVPFSRISCSGAFTGSASSPHSSYIPRPRSLALGTAPSSYRLPPPPVSECFRASTRNPRTSPLRGFPLTRAPPALPIREH